MNGRSHPSRSLSNGRSKNVLQKTIWRPRSLAARGRFLLPRSLRRRGGPCPCAARSGPPRPHPAAAKHPRRWPGVPVRRRCPFRPAGAAGCAPGSFAPQGGDFCRSGAFLPGGRLCPCRGYAILPTQSNETGPVPLRGAACAARGRG